MTTLQPKTALPMKPPADTPPSSELAEVLPDPVSLALTLATVPSDQVALLAWLVQHGREQGCANFADLARLIARDSSTVSRVLRGKYGAGLGPFCEHVAKYRAHWQADQDGGAEPFVATLSVVTEIEEVVKIAIATGQLAIITGRAQCGKTKALEYLAATLPNVVYVKMPAGGGTKEFMKAVAKALGISSKKDLLETRDRVLRRLTRQHLLIVDELHQALMGRSLKTTTLERLREMFDDTKCGLVLCGTDVIEDSIRDARYKAFLEQIDFRGVLRRRIPNEPTTADRNALAAAYSLPKPTGSVAALVKQIANDNGIARLADYFILARRRALKAKVDVSWEDFTATHSMLTLWASGKRTEDAQ